MPSPLPEDVHTALAAGQKIEAIRLLREQTGLGLAEAKAAVESGGIQDAEAGQGFAPSMPAEVRAALTSGNKLLAIKLLRRTKGISLKQAKDIVDEASGMSAGPGGINSAGLSPGEVPRRGWSVAIVVFIVVLLGAAVWLYLFSA